MEHDTPPEGRAGPRRKDVDPLKGLAQHSGGIGSLGAAGKYAGIGLQFALSILVFLYAGQWVDRKLGTEIFMLLGVLVGFGAAFYSIYRSLMADQRRDEEEAAAQARAESSRDGRGT